MQPPEAQTNPRVNDAATWNELIRDSSEKAVADLWPVPVQLLCLVEHQLGYTRYHRQPTSHLTGGQQQHSRDARWGLPKYDSAQLL